VSPNAIWFVAILLFSALSSLGGYYATSRALAEPLHKLSMTTPVLVLDRAALVKSLPPEAPPELILKAMDEWRQKAEQLARAGYLVIDSGMVVAAPEDVYVRTEP
jgi:hypothetical protein